MTSWLRVARPHDDRIGTNLKAARRLTALCGRLPLALQIAAAILNSDPTLSTEHLAYELAAEQDRLATLRYDDSGRSGSPRSVEAAFDTVRHSNAVLRTFYDYWIERGEGPLL
jgi:hypothetical protein